MSKCVHNCVFCDEAGRDSLLRRDGRGAAVTELWDGFLVLFDTIASSGHNAEAIINYISEHRTASWYCMDSNGSEQNCYYWNCEAEEVVSERRPFPMQSNS